MEFESFVLKSEIEHLEKIINENLNDLKDLNKTKLQLILLKMTMRKMLKEHFY